MLELDKPYTYHSLNIMITFCARLKKQQLGVFEKNGIFQCFGRANLSRVSRKKNFSGLSKID